MKLSRIILIVTIMSANQLLTDQRIYPVVYAGEINSVKAVRAIIGEDSSSYLGMYAVACAIRNRGSLNGVYGLKAVRKHGNGLVRVHPVTGRVVEAINANTYSLATRAWSESAKGPDVVRGSRQWEGAKLKKPYWEGDFKHSLVMGENRFYYN